MFRSDQGLNEFSLETFNFTKRVEVCTEKFSQTKFFAGNSGLTGSFGSFLIYIQNK